MEDLLQTEELQQLLVPSHMVGQAVVLTVTAEAAVVVVLGVHIIMETVQVMEVIVIHI